MDVVIAFNDQLTTLDSLTDATAGYACEFLEASKRTEDHRIDEIEVMNDALQNTIIAADQINAAYDHILSTVLQDAFELGPDYNALFEKAEHHIDGLIKALDEINRFNTNDPLTALCFLHKLCSIRSDIIAAVDCSVDLKDQMIRVATKEG